jgi:hypothetical protein
MEALKDNLHYLKFIKDIVLNKNQAFFLHQIINENKITENTISIVMTAHERSKQTYYTLNTISKSKFKDIQIILVDDSKYDPVDIEVLRNIGIHIELIRIMIGNKFWVNPCINYNIGFQYIKGSKVVIQNAEVCHVGDVIDYINNNVIDNNYYTFDVKGSRNFNSNEIIYSYDILDSDIYNKDIYQGGYSSWYHHSIQNRNNYHFLTVQTTNTFNKYKGFTYDYAFGCACDDDDLLLKIKHFNLNIININSDIENIGGIHLYHGFNENIKDTVSDKLSYIVKSNIGMFYKKKKYLEVNKIYLELSDCQDYVDLNEMYNILNMY